MMYEPSTLSIDTNISDELQEAIKDLPLKEKVIEVVKTVYDPEIPVSIWELGLVYELDVNDEGIAEIVMTLTAPACPVAETLPNELAEKLRKIPEIKDAKVEIVWEPEWNRDMMSEAAKLELGMY